MSPARPNKRLRVMLTIATSLAFLFAVLATTIPTFMPNLQGGIAWLREGGPFFSEPSRITTYERDGRLYLWGGDGDTQVFDVTECLFDIDQLHYALGREFFPALIEPTFIPADQVGDMLAADEPALVVAIGGDERIYPLATLRRHEVVNDEVGGRPIFAAWCVLAGLGAVYDRDMGGHTLTFGVSGYTYADADVWHGLDAFVLWDRDTESLWWPPLGKAVSGPLIGTPMPVLDRELWSQTTWGEARKRWPEAKVLAPGQTLERPGSWRKLGDSAISQVRSGRNGSDDGVAPGWGENAP